VARHERSYSRRQRVLDLEHYLDVLERKPGALAGSSPLQQWRERGRWPESSDRLWRSLRERHGSPAGTWSMIELLVVGKREGWDRLRRAIEEALALGCTEQPQCTIWPLQMNSIVHSANRFPWVHWNVMTGRCSRCRSMTYCSARTLPRRWPDEPAHPSSGTCECAAVL
jgi:hypothetical protein